MYSSDIPHRSNIVLQQTKNKQVKSLLILTKQLSLKQIALFLAGFVIGELKLTAINKRNMAIINKFGQIIELIRDGLLQLTNMIQATIQALDHAKKSQDKAQHREQSNNKNRMRSQYEPIFEQNKRSVSQDFLQCYSNIVGQLALDRSYLKNLWAAEVILVQQQRINQQAVRKMIAEQDQIMKQKNKQRQSQKMQCQICLVPIQFEEMGTLNCCKHMFHSLCLHEHVKASVIANKVQIGCPMQGCNQQLTINDIENYIQGQMLNKYHQFSLNHYVEAHNSTTSWCPTAGCSALFQFDQMLDNYRCPVCKKHYCLKCRCEYHNGMTCAEYRVNNSFGEQDRKFQDFVRGAKFKQCPKCKYWVEKAAGCCSMDCRCGMQFCYDCGGTGCPHGKCTGSGKSNNGVVNGIIIHPPRPENLFGRRI